VVVVVLAQMVMVSAGAAGLAGLEQQPRLLLQPESPSPSRWAAVALAIMVMAPQVVTPFLVPLPLLVAAVAVNSSAVEVVVARAAVRGGLRVQVVRVQVVREMPVVEPITA